MSDKEKLRETLKEHGELRNLAYESGYCAGRMGERASPSGKKGRYHSRLQAAITKRNAISARMDAALAATEGAETPVVWEEQQILRFVETRNLDCHWLVCDENGLSAGLTIPTADKEEGQKLDRERVVVQVRRKG